MQVTVEKIVDVFDTPVENDQQTCGMFWMLRALLIASQNFHIPQTVRLHTSEMYSAVTTDMLVGQFVFDRNLQITDVLTGVFDDGDSLIKKLVRGGKVTALSNLLTEYFKATPPGHYTVKLRGDGYEDVSLFVMIPSDGPKAPCIRWHNPKNGKVHYFHTSPSTESSV